MGKYNDRGVIQEVIRAAAKDLTRHLLSITAFDKVLDAGHNRYKIIDGIMYKGMGTDVSKYWAKQGVEYRALLRRKIWERSLRLIRIGTIELNLRKRPPRSTSRGSLIDSVSEERD